MADTRTHVGDNDKIIGEAPGRDPIQDGGFTNMLNILVLAMVFTGLERPVLQAFRNAKRMFSTIVVLKSWRGQ